jgi:hypothetical protein
MKPSMFLLFHYLFLSSITSRTTASPFGFDNALGIALVQRTSCSLVACGNPDCQGVSTGVYTNIFKSFEHPGTCYGGSYVGCNCISTCTTYLGPCDDEVNCYGVNDETTGQGVCQRGYYAGCPCQASCGAEPVDCDYGGCEGINLPGGDPGYCTIGGLQGCSCNSVCPDQDVDCDDCNGDDYVCFEGPYAGCPCGTDCGNISNQPCDISGCNGQNYPDFGFGICTENFAGCSCIMMCNTNDFEGPCNDPKCAGVNGVCTTGIYNGCYCDE